MRNFDDRVENLGATAAGRLSADEDNVRFKEMENAVSTAGITLDAQAGPDSDLNMIAQAQARYASLGRNGTAGGSANALTVAAIGSAVVPKAHFSGMSVRTVPTTTNTDAATANVFSLGSKKVLRYDGTPMQPGDLAAGVPTEWVYSTTADSGTGAWLVEPWALALAGLDRMPIYPEIDTAGNVLAMTASTGQIVVDAGQRFRHRGHRVVYTTDTSSGSRTFATAINKTYHLRWTWSAGAGTYSLVDMTSASPAETDSSYDSTYDMMLIAKVVTNGSNVLTVTALKNAHRMQARGELLFSAVTWDGDLVAPSALTSGTTTSLNWARRPQVALNMMTSISTKHGADTISVQQLNVGNWSRSRYSFFTTYQKTELPQSGYVGYEAHA